MGGKEAIVSAPSENQLLGLLAHLLYDCSRLGILEAPAKEFNTIVCPADPGLGIQADFLLLDFPANPLKAAAGGGLVRHQQNHVIHVADVVPDTQELLYDPVHPVEVQQGKALAGLVAHGQPLPISIGINHFLQQPPRVAVKLIAAELLVQNLVVYAGKVLADVQLDEVSCGSLLAVMAGHGGTEQFNGIVGSLAHPTGTVCVYEVILQQGNQEVVAETVLHNSVPVGDCLNLPLLGVVNHELPVASDSVAVVFQLVVQLPQVLAQIGLEFYDLPLVLLASPGTLVGLQETFE